MRKYYEAYDERYKTAHSKGVSWLSDKSTPIVLDILRKYNVGKSDNILEIGCGEGRDSKAVLESGYKLFAADISAEAIEYCQKTQPLFKEHFAVLDCLNGKHQNKYDFIYSVAVIHMLVSDEDRNRFYGFIREHLSASGAALICSMGDGISEMRTDPNAAFELREREHKSGKMTVAATSCRTVSFEKFENEIASNGLVLLEKGITAAPPDFDSLMFAVVKQKSSV